MNLFQKYGIKEVADVTFCNIMRIDDEEFYIPVLHLDTLKISTLEKKSTNVTQSGGYGNSKILSWNFGKDISLGLEDALFSPASMNLTYGWLSSELSVYTAAIAKISIANKYGRLHYSTIAKPSPRLTDKEWEVIFFVWGKLNNSHITKEFVDKPYVNEKRVKLQKNYRERPAGLAMDENIILALFLQIDTMQKLGYIDTDTYEVETIDRLEHCYVESADGLTIDVRQQYKNLYRYYTNDKGGSYTIYYDIKTMQPLLLDKGGNLTSGKDVILPDGSAAQPILKLKQGTEYYKWTRTVEPKNNDNSIIGKTLVINSNTFPSEFRIVGETYIREQNTQRDQRYQFVINRATITSDTNIALKADGEPTTFAMRIQALNTPTGNMVELRQFNVDEDTSNGGTRIIPQDTKYSYTPVDIQQNINKIYNLEIY